MAVKKIRMPPINDPSSASTMKRIETEIDLMQQLSHPNVVEYLGMEEHDNNLFVFLEYMAGGSLLR
jgi:serine/threonine protein kinase